MCSALRKSNLSRKESTSRLFIKNCILLIIKKTMVPYTSPPFVIRVVSVLSGYFGQGNVL